MDIMVFVCFEGTFTRLFFGIIFSFLGLLHMEVLMNQF